MVKRIYLSYFIDEATPTYGNRNVVSLVRKSNMSVGDVANETHIQSTLHIGTHIDFPFHFYNEGKTLEDYSPDFWIFNHPLLIEIEPRSLVVKDEVIEVLEQVRHNDNADILLIKTGYCHKRGGKEYWEQNIGFSPDIYDYITEFMPAIRVIGFDSISVSSFQHRDIGRQAHRKFLNPENPILLLEDMDLRQIAGITDVSQVIISPLMIAGADGVPCSVVASINFDNK